MNVAFSPLSTLPQTGVLAAGIFEEGQMTPGAEALAKAAGLDLKAVLEAAKFKGKKDQTLYLPLALNGKMSLLFVGLGKKRDLSTLDAEHLGARIYKALGSSEPESCAVFTEGLGSLASSVIAAHIAHGAELRSFRFDKYKTKDKKEWELKTLTVQSGDPAASEKLSKALAARREGVALTRIVVNEPPNVLTPLDMARRAREELEPLGVEVEVLDVAALKKLGMGALLGVGQGSANPACVIVLQWKGSKESPIAFVGKGVTFDTGGISIKPSANMDEMKHDMGGSGVILGLFKTLAQRKAPVHVVGVLGMVENMPSGTAQRPGDIVKTISGQTVEVLDTDAEGRLVLADALWYAQDRFKPQAMIDLATLTGAIGIALGDEFAGLFSNNDALCEKLQGSGETVGEKLWRMPMAESFDRDMDSDIADVRNIGTARYAGSSKAAGFLQRFVNNIPWAHLDIAYTSWDKKDRNPLVGTGATAFGVRLLDEFLNQHYEK